MQGALQLSHRADAGLDLVESHSVVRRVFGVSWRGRRRGGLVGLRIAPVYGIVLELSAARLSFHDEHLKTKGGAKLETEFETEFAGAWTVE